MGLTPATVATLASDGIAHGIKQSGPSLDAFRRIVSLTRDMTPSFCCMHGASALASTTLRLGGQGLVCAGANVVPQSFTGIMHHALESRWAEADAAQQAANRIWDALMGCVADRSSGTTPNVPVMKWLLAHQGVIDRDAVRPPLSPLTTAERAALERTVIPILMTEVSP